MTLNRPIYEYLPGEGINLLLGSAVFKGQVVYKDTTARRVSRAIADTIAIGVAMEDKSSGSYCRIALSKPIMYVQASPNWSTPAAGNLCAANQGSTGSSIGTVSYVGAATSSTGQTYATYGRPFGIVFDATLNDSSYISVIVL